MKIKKLILLIPSLLVLTSCGNLNLAEDIKSKLIPNLGSFLTQFAALVVIVVLIIIFGYKPIKKMLKQRQDYIENNIKEAKEKNDQATVTLNQSKEEVLSSRKLASEIVLEAKTKANEERERILKETELDVISMKKKAEEDILRSQEEAKEDIRKEMVNVALSASSELLKRNISSEDNEKLVKDFIEDNLD